MAVSARDLYFAVRVEDRATRPLRRIAADFRALGKAGLAQRVAAAEQANLAERTARSRLKGVAAQIETVKAQRTETATAARAAAQAERTTRAKLAESGVLKSMRELDRSRITNATKLSQIETAIAQRRSAAGQKYEQVLAKADTIQPAALARARRGILMSGLSMAQLEEHQQSLLMQTANLNLEETRLAERAGVAAGALSKQAAATAQLSAADAKLAAEEALLNEEFATASLRHSETIRRQNLANKSVREFPIERLQGAGRIISHLGRVLATFGAIGAASFGFLGVAAANFGKQVTLAATQSTTLAHNSVMQVQKNAAFINAEIQKILSSGRVIAQPEEQTAAVYRIFSGITLKGNQLSQLRQGIVLLKEFNRVTTANMGLVSLEEVTRAGITLINRFGYTAANIRDPLNTMQAAVRFGDITLSEFIASMNQAAPAAQAAGFSFRDMAVGIAFASRQFSQVRMGSTGYARLVETFSKRDTIDGLKAQGVAITTLAGGFEHLLPIQEIARRIIAKFGGDVKKGTVFVQNFFKEIGNTQGTIQARRYLEALLHRLPLFNTIFRQVTKDKTELDKSFAAAQQDPGVRWQEFTIQLRGLALEIGSGVIPAVAGLANEVRGLASWFNNLSPHTKELIGQWGFLVAVGTLVIGIFSVIAGGAVQLVAMLALLGKGFGLLASETGSAMVLYAGLLPLFAALAFAIIHFPGFRSVIAEDIGPIAKYITVLIGLRIGVAALTIVANIATAAMIRLGAASAAAALGQITALLGPIALVTVALLGMQVAIGLLENEMVKSVRYYTIINGKSQEQSKAYEQEARKVGDLAAHYAELIRQRKELASIGPGGQPIAPGGGVVLPKLPVGFPVHGRGTTPGFGFGDTDKQVSQLERAAQRAARALNVPVTPQFRQLFAEYVKAQNALTKLKREGASTMQMFEAETRLKTAVDNLKSFSKAAIQAAKDLLKVTQQFSDKQIMAEGKKVNELEKLAKKKGTFAAWKTYFQALKKLQDDATDIQLQAVQQMFDTTVSAADKTTNKLKDIYNDVLSNLKSQFDNFQQQNETAFGELFQGPFMKSAGMQESLDWSYILKPADLLKDLRQQVAAFRNWRRDIEKLRKLGLPESLLDKIMALGPEQGKQQVELIRKMTPKQLEAYKSAWLMGQKDIHKATMSDMNRQLNQWRKQGQRIALAIARGLRDENASLENALRDMILRAFPNLKGGAGKPRKAAMGMVTPGTGTGDTVHAMLTPGELVLNQKHQRGLKQKLGVSGGPHALFGHIQKFADGGVVGAMKSVGHAIAYPFEAEARRTGELNRFYKLQQSLVPIIGRQKSSEWAWEILHGKKFQSDLHRSRIHEQFQAGGVVGDRFHHERGESNIKPHFTAAQRASLRLIRAYERNPSIPERKYPDFNWHNLGAVLTAFTGIDPGIIRQRQRGNFGVLGPGGRPMVPGQVGGGPAIMGGPIGRAGKIISEAERWDDAANEARYLLADAAAQVTERLKTINPGTIYQVGGRAAIHGGVRERVPAIYYKGALFIGNKGEIHGTLAQRMLEKYNMPDLEQVSLLNRPGVSSKSQKLLASSKQLELWPENHQYLQNIPERWMLPEGMEPTPDIVSLLQRWRDVEILGDPGTTIPAGAAQAAKLASKLRNAVAGGIYHVVKNSMSGSHRRPGLLYNGMLFMGTKGMIHRDVAERALELFKLPGIKGENQARRALNFVNTAHQVELWDAFKDRYMDIPEHWKLPQGLAPDPEVIKLLQRYRPLPVQDSKNIMHLRRAGRAAARAEASVVAPINHAQAYKEFDAFAATLDDPKEALETLGMLKAAYEKHTAPAAELLQKRLAKAGIHNAHITSMFHKDDIGNIIDQLTRDVTGKADADKFGLSHWRPSFSVSLGSGDMAASFSAFFGKDGRFRLDDLLDPSDTDFFKHPSEYGKYSKALAAVRAEKKKAEFITLYRGMSGKEYLAWKDGAKIPPGKFFTEKATTQKAQDIQGKFPELFKFKVRAEDVTRLTDGDYVLHESAFMGLGNRISSAAQHARKMAEGGIVTRPTHALIGERGPEAVIPLNKMGSQTPTNVEQHVPGETVHYHITSTASESDVRKQAKEAAWHHRTRFKK